ncbi:phenylalanine-4-hydroxylase [Galdieria sulphuraria]|uniref:phenylalanine 4-monooxygenase n=1 Tax=Galdieria sulphuraria TaxID=130081 RepID=M2XFV2_GALSU|nr:phenylalanine-4-hydroxylase [Galdieria sulphuraria]EME28902.1 phenylalanine-4-hydroxylase [Galdieria sulphuraria]|eukprot:XP_005705422.1 phenylalanine-4-hydroxylase [Galdieria sulphuraria]
MSSNVWKSLFYSYPWRSRFLSPTNRISKRYLSVEANTPTRFSGSNTLGRISLVVRVPNTPGSLTQPLAVLGKYQVNLSRIESRPTTEVKQPDASYDIFVNISEETSPVVTSGSLVDRIKKAVEELTSQGIKVTVLGEGFEDMTQSVGEVSTLSGIPWFPRKMRDLDAFSSRTLEFGAELDADHPGFHDKAYRERRQSITENAKQYGYGQPLPHVTYSEKELKTWNTVYTELTKLYPTHACKQYRYIFPLLEKNCGYSPHQIPQLQDVSEFLRECTGFRLRPVMGLLSPRDFLNGLAFRVFHSTQYIRHHSKPLYTPEPDVCHELLGHAPMLADPDFAEFSHQIGLASLGASDEDIDRLARCYWFSVEFGLLKEDGQVKAYGAGLLSSFGELQYALGNEPQLLPWDPFVASQQPYPITQYQPVYFVADSFSSATDKFLKFAETISRPFSVWYNPYSQTIEIIDSIQKIMKIAGQTKQSCSLVTEALRRLETRVGHAS